MSQSTDESTTTPGPDTGVEDRRTMTNLLIGLPLICAAILGGWSVWRWAADLDDIERRQLAWDTILELTWEHLLLTVITTAVVLVTAIPMGILLTRPTFRFLAAPVVGFANAGQAAPAVSYTHLTLPTKRIV